MDCAKNFNFYIPLTKSAISGDILEGIASTDSVDRDSERMSNSALIQMRDEIRSVGVNLFGNHEHNWENTLGAIKDANIVGNALNVKITLDDPNTNPKIPMLLNKMKKGIQLGLSVGGQVISEKWEYNKELNKKIKVIDKLKLLEVSVVGIPSNPDSFLSIQQQISKSISEKCPCCYGKVRIGKCSICLWSK